MYFDSNAELCPIRLTPLSDSATNQTIFILVGSKIYSVIDTYLGFVPFENDEKIG